MSSALRNIIAAGITLGLSDRNTFVKKVADVIDEYQKDPAKAEKWAQVIADYAEQFKNDTRLENIIERSNSGMAGAEDIERLTKAIEKLTNELQNRKKT